MSLYPKTFSPVTIGPLSLRNRIALAPLTRQNAEWDGTPTAEMAAYHARRARGGTGLIITEGTWQNDEFGCAAYLSQPGILTKRHIEGWKRVTEAVHALGAKIILQLMHGGRVTDPRCLHEGESPVSASDTQSGGFVLYTNSDAELHDRGLTGAWPMVTFPPARALTVAEIHRVAEGFAEGAARAVEAGFDGVEIHGANGYLLYQFIHPETNHRTDEFGGSPAGNARIANLVCEKVRAAIGPEKFISLRLSQDGVDMFTGAWPGGVSYARALGAALKDCAADALHWSSFGWNQNRDPADPTPMPVALKEASGKAIIVNGGIADGPEAEAVFEAGAGEIVAVGRPMFAQPDWPHIIRSGMAYDWAPFDRKYVIQPPVDLGLAYPQDRVVPGHWDPDLTKRRKKGWMGG